MEEKGKEQIFIYFLWQYAQIEWGVYKKIGESHLKITISNYLEPQVTQC